MTNNAVPYNVIRLVVSLACGIPVVACTPIESEPVQNIVSPVAPDSPKPKMLDPRFDTCAEVVDNGFGPYMRGRDKEYEWYRDGDGDGEVCE